MARYSARFRDLAFRWLVFGEGRIPPPKLWRIVAWAFLLVGMAFYLTALWLVVRRSLGWAVGAAALGYLLRRQVGMVAPRLLERIDQELRAVEEPSVEVLWNCLRLSRDGVMGMKWGTEREVAKETVLRAGWTITDELPDIQECLTPHWGATQYQASIHFPDGELNSLRLEPVTSAVSEVGLKKLFENKLGSALPLSMGPESGAPQLRNRWTLGHTVISTGLTDEGTPVLEVQSQAR